MIGHFEFSFSTLKLFEHNRVQVCFSNYNSLRYTLNFEISMIVLCSFIENYASLFQSPYLKSVLMYSKEFFEQSPLRFCYNLFCHFSCSFPNYYTEGLRVTGLKIQKKKAAYHMSICVEYSVDPKRTSGGLYLKKTHPISLIQRMLRDGAAKHKGPVNYTRSNPNRGLTQAVGLRYSL